jgi:hypothetical protein
MASDAIRDDDGPQHLKRNCLPPPGACQAQSIGLSFREAGRLGLPEPLWDVAAEGIDEQELASGAVGLVVAVHLAPPLRLAQQDPVGRPVAGPGEALAVHQGLWMVVTQAC